MNHGPNNNTPSLATAYKDALIFCASLFNPASADRAAARRSQKIKELLSNTGSREEGGTFSIGHSTSCNLALCKNGSVRLSSFKSTLSGQKLCADVMIDSEGRMKRILDDGSLRRAGRRVQNFVDLQLDKIDPKNKKEGSVVAYGGHYYQVGPNGRESTFGLSVGSKLGSSASSLARANTQL